MAKEKTVLAIQDTTSLNYTAHLATEGLGPIGTCGTRLSLGLYVHSTLALNLAGTPLGLLDDLPGIVRGENGADACVVQGLRGNGRQHERPRCTSDRASSPQWFTHTRAPLRATL